VDPVIRFLLLFLVDPVVHSLLLLLADPVARSPLSFPADLGDPEYPADLGDPEYPADLGDPEYPADPSDPEYLMGLVYLEGQDGPSDPEGPGNIEVGVLFVYHRLLLSYHFDLYYINVIV
jgi:hypothetical protein